jgi:hypothetical protein
MSLFARTAVAGCSFVFVLSSSSLAQAGLEGDDADSTESPAQDRAPEPTTPPVITPASASTNADAPRAPRPPRKDAKRFVVARDFGVALPVGELAETAAAMYGPLVRLGFHVDDSFEIGIRAGYQRGFDKEVRGVTGSLSSVPFYTSARWFFFGNRELLYAGLELGVNVFRHKHTARTSVFDVSADATWVRPSANIGLGFVWSRATPVDIRAQVSSLDLISKDGPIGAIAVGVTGGYSIFF